jgi:hypothetical protein
MDVILVDRDGPLQRGVSPSTAAEGDNVDTGAFARRDVIGRITEEHDSIPGAPAGGAERRNDLVQRGITRLTVSGHDVVEQIRNA